MGVFHKDLLALQFLDLLVVFVGQRGFLHVVRVPDVDLVFQNFSHGSARPGVETGGIQIGAGSSGSLVVLVSTLIGDDLLGVPVLFLVAVGRFAAWPLSACIFLMVRTFLLVSLAWSSLAQLRMGLKSMLLSSRKSMPSLTAMKRAPFSGK